MLLRFCCYCCCHHQSHTVWLLLLVLVSHYAPVGNGGGAGGEHFVYVAVSTGSTHTYHFFFGCVFRKLFWFFLPSHSTHSLIHSLTPNANKQTHTNKFFWSTLSCCNTHTHTTANECVSMCRDNEKLERGIDFDLFVRIGASLQIVFWHP